MEPGNKLTHPWLAAVWPGMGHVALNAGVYLLSKLGMTQVAEVETGDLFDVEAVEVEGGLVRPVRRPRSRFFLWADPNERHDLLVFVGEAQPPAGRFAFCRRLVAFAKELGVERVFTFAAMATRMHPARRSRVYAAATDATNLDEMKRLELDVLTEGHIGGLNGVLLAAAADAGLHGACLLGEMPHIFAQLPFPKASLAVLESFSALTGIKLDLGELSAQAEAVEEQLEELLGRIESQLRKQNEGEGDEEGEGEGGFTPEPPDEADEEDAARIEELFDQAADDRSKAFELKQELDKLGRFKEYEDRFLDLFRKAEGKGGAG